MVTEKCRRNVIKDSGKVCQTTLKKVLFNIGSGAKSSIKFGCDCMISQRIKYHICIKLEEIHYKSQYRTKYDIFLSVEATPEKY